MMTLCVEDSAFIMRKHSARFREAALRFRKRVQAARVPYYARAEGLRLVDDLIKYNSNPEAGVDAPVRRLHGPTYDLLQPLYLSGLFERKCVGWVDGRVAKHAYLPAWIDRDFEDRAERSGKRGRISKSAAVEAAQIWRDHGEHDSAHG